MGGYPPQLVTSAKRASPTPCFLSGSWCEWLVYRSPPLCIDGVFASVGMVILMVSGGCQRVLFGFGRCSAHGIAISIPTNRTWYSNLNNNKSTRKIPLGLGL
ncbi:unnamed protein product [Discosporangium mesarthrocarpum]